MFKRKLLQVFSFPMFLAGTLLLLAQPASAARLSYDFSSAGISQILTPFSGADRVVFTSLGGSTANFVYDTVSNGGRLRIDGTGRVREATVVNGRLVYGNVLESSTNFAIEIDFSGVTEITNPQGALGYAGIHATSNGVISIDSLGDVTGDGSNDRAYYNLETKQMNFAPYANNANYYGSEIAHLGTANFFLWQSTLLNDLVAKAWTRSSYGVGSLSSLFNVANGDIHLGGGSGPTQVPEPATSMLLGVGALGAVLRKRKLKS